MPGSPPDDAPAPRAADRPAGGHVPASEADSASEGADRPAGEGVAAFESGSDPVVRPRIARRSSDSGPVLPDVTDDERDIGWGERPEPDDDERLLREVPPHHGN